MNVERDEILQRIRVLRGRIAIERNLVALFGEGVDEEA
jgi:hypothetical protein